MTESRNASRHYAYIEPGTLGDAELCCSNGHETASKAEEHAAAKRWERWLAAEKAQKEKERESTR